MGGEQDVRAAHLRVDPAEGVDPVTRHSPGLDTVTAGMGTLQGGGVNNNSLHHSYSLKVQNQTLYYHHFKLWASYMHLIPLIVSH